MTPKTAPSSMTLDQFQSLVRILANSAWLRYYLHSQPGRMVLEIANLGAEDLSGLRSELQEKGFQEEPGATVAGVSLVRFSVARSNL